ncbi:MAG: penicillin-binding transpeptidase domain-containing protein [Myxococcaceae bacterium]
MLAFIAISPAGAASIVAMDGGASDAGTLVLAAACPPGADQALDERLSALDVAEGEPLKVPSRLKDPPIASARPLAPALDLLTHARRNPAGQLEVPVDGGTQRLTVDTALQDKLTAILRTYETPYAAVVALEPSTGRVLAMAEHSQADPSMRGLCTKAIYPAASIFKIVTASALLAEGVKPGDAECFHGGKRKLTESHLVDSARDQRCAPFAAALAYSLNGVFAKLTFKHLTPARLAAEARAFRFNSALAFPVPTETSLAAIPDDPFGLSSAGAGFGDVYLSPLHGAAIAAVAANGGLWRTPVLFEGEAPAAAPRVMSEQNAQALTDMLEQTVVSGTARRIFHERGHRVAGAVGKTGSLADKRPFRDYSWFVGFAPRDAPKVAVAAVIVNDPLWRIRATWLGREAMRLYLAQQR